MSFREGFGKIMMAAAVTVSELSATSTTRRLMCYQNSIKGNDWPVIIRATFLRGSPSDRDCGDDDAAEQSGAALPTSLKTMLGDI
jgi:hypothetical protein